MYVLILTTTDLTTKVWLFVAPLWESNGKELVLQVNISLILTLAVLLIIHDDCNTFCTIIVADIVGHKPTEKERYRESNYKICSWPNQLTFQISL